jgi:2-polyprenyl-3-methyl-5-hydroxy-6-metoxy-1,4-benzoquinol methylase
MKCKLCDSNKTRQIHDKIWSLEHGCVFRCDDCDVTFIDPFLTKDQSNDIYGHFNEFAMTRGVNTESSPEHDFKKRQPKIKRRFDNLKHLFISGTSVCKIRSASGGFLALLKESFAIETYAVEINKDNLEFSSQYYTKAFKTIDDIPDDLLFDTICMFHVFEHIELPIEFLKEIQNTSIKMDI